MEKTDTTFAVSVPPIARDVIQEAEYVDEILRIYGFNNIELSETASTEYFPNFLRRMSINTNALRRASYSNGSVNPGRTR
jgi:phenylalanyl-tRNA synthetase beta subunit